MLFSQSKVKHVNPFLRSPNQQEKSFGGLFEMPLWKFDRWIPYRLPFSSVRNIFAWNLKKMGNWCLIKDFLLDFSDCNLKHFMQMPFRLFPLSNFCHMVWTKVLKSSEFGIKWIPSQISKVTFTNLGDFSRLPEREWKTLKLWSSVKEVSDWAKVELMGVKLANITLYNFFIQRWALLSYPLILSYPHKNMNANEMLLIGWIQLCQLVKEAEYSFVFTL